MVSCTCTICILKTGFFLLGILFCMLISTVYGFNYAPNFEEVEGAYWFGSVRAVLRAVSQSVMREHSVRNR